jgi:chromosome segregation ATPase
MSENDNDFFVETYIKKQESLFLEQTRRLLQADTKSTVLEIALNERNATVGELEEQVRQLNIAISQAVNGLQGITNDRDALQKKLTETEEKNQYLTELQNKYKTVENDLATKYRTVENELASKNVIVEKLSNQLQTYQKDMDQLRENYNKVNDVYKTVENELANKSVIAEKLNTKVETYQKDMDQIKENYNKVHDALEEANSKLSKLSNIKNSKKKLTPTNSEWTDGNQV